MNLKDEEIRVEATWRTDEKPSSSWRRLVAKIFTSRKESHPERGKGKKNE